MSDLNDLYRQVIIDHNKNPHNFGELSQASHSAQGSNPLCGDKISVQMIIENDIITDINFQGEGCAISRASSSIMTTLLKGKKITEAEKIFENFHNLLTTESPALISPEKLIVFSGVKEFPMRVKCATLPWHTMNAALKKEKKVVTTE